MALDNNIWCYLYFLEYALPQVCRSANTMFLICHVILGDHIIKALYDFMGGRPSH